MGIFVVCCTEVKLLYFICCHGDPKGNKIQKSLKNWIKLILSIFYHIGSKVKLFERAKLKD